jgi:hypothetical protein
MIKVEVSCDCDNKTTLHVPVYISDEVNATLKSMGWTYYEYEKSGEVIRDWRCPICNVEGRLECLESNINERIDEVIYRIKDGQYE